MDIKNKTILITGAASGLGAATTRELSRRGAKTILLDRNIALAKKLPLKLMELLLNAMSPLKILLNKCFRNVLTFTP